MAAAAAAGGAGYAIPKRALDTDASEIARHLECIRDTMDAIAYFKTCLLHGDGQVVVRSSDEFHATVVGLLTRGSGEDGDLLQDEIASERQRFVHLMHGAMRYSLHLYNSIQEGMDYSRDVGITVPQVQHTGGKVDQLLGMLQRASDAVHGFGGARGGGGCEMFQSMLCFMQSLRDLRNFLSVVQSEMENPQDAVMQEFMASIACPSPVSKRMRRS